MSTPSEELPPEAQPLSDEEKACQEKVREILGDRAENIDEWMFIQFIRGYSYEEEWATKVAEMLTKTLDWREENDVDNICNEKFEKRALFKDTWTTVVSGYDPVGRLITVDRLGKITPGDLLEKFTEKELQMNHVQNQEFLAKMKKAKAKETGKRLYKIVSIVDLDGVGMGHTASKFTGPARAMTDIDQWFYPESMHKMYMVNVPWVFKMIWKIVRPWLHPKTQEKIQVCGSNYLAEMEADGITKDQLPEFLGGTGTDKLLEFEESWTPDSDTSEKKKKHKKKKKKSDSETPKE